LIILRRRDRLPTVAVLQSYLNQQESTTEYLEVDGIFGRKTEGAVQLYRRENGRGTGGAVDYDLWRTVVGDTWQIIDSVDRTDFDSEKHAVLDHEDLAPYGQTVLEQFGMSRGGPLVLRSLRLNARTGEVVLMRFHGHGSPGSMVVSSGRSGGTTFDHSFGQRFYDALRELRPIFAAFGSVEMHGCRVGRGNAGRTLLSGMANAIGVPVSAAVNSQWGGGQTTFRFEGATKTACPGGQSLKAWAGSMATTSEERPAAPF